MYIFCQLPFIFGPSPFKGAHQKQPTHQRRMNVFSTFKVSIWTWTISLASRLALSRPVTSNCLFDNNLSLLCSNKEKTFYAKTRYYPLLVSSGHFPLACLLGFTLHRKLFYYQFENAQHHSPARYIQFSQCRSCGSLSFLTYEEFRRVNYFIVHRHPPHRNRGLCIVML